MLNYTTDIDKQILAAEKEVKLFLIEKLNEFKKNSSILTAIRGSLYYDQADERMEIIQQRIQNISEGSE